AIDTNLAVTLFDASNGNIDTNRQNGLSVKGKAGDRIVLLIEQDNVEPNSALSVLFTNKLYTGTSTTPDDVNTYLHTLLKLETASVPAAGASPTWIEVADVYYSVDSGSQRVLIKLPSSLQRG